MLYAAGSNSPGAAVFLTSGNFTNTAEGGTPLQTNAKPYGTKGFVVFRRSGEGTILRARDVGATNLVGTYVPLCR